MEERHGHLYKSLNGIWTREGESLDDDQKGTATYHFAWFPPDDEFNFNIGDSNDRSGVQAGGSGEINMMECTDI